MNAATVRTRPSSRKRGLGLSSTRHGRRDDGRLQHAPAIDLPLQHQQARGDDEHLVQGLAGIAVQQQLAAVARAGARRARRPGLVAADQLGDDLPSPPAGVAVRPLQDEEVDLPAARVPPFGVAPLERPPERRDEAG